MIGADGLVKTLAEAGVTACFANPGTSEMHLVQALDREPRIRSVLCLFEGVATGAADGFARISGVPAMTLLHLGPGYANGAANIHNARKARVPMINVVGEHATYHRRFDAPLSSDIETLVKPNSRWVGTVEQAHQAGPLALAAFEATYGPAPAPVSLILPADAAWNEGGSVTSGVRLPDVAGVDTARIEEVARAIKSATRPVLYVDGEALRDDGIAVLARIGAAGVRVMAPTFPARWTRGGDFFHPDRMYYFAEMAMQDLSGTDLLVLAGSPQPVGFFAYPGKPSVIVPEGCRALEFSTPEQDTLAGLKALADALGAPAEPVKPTKPAAPERPVGDLSPASIGISLARHMPEGSIISDDGVTAGLPIFMATRGAARHDWLSLTGGAIGQGMPLAIGTAVAAPDRKTICLTGDGAGMYTVQSLWTMARENLPVVTIVFANRSYRVLNIELARTGAGNPGPTAAQMLSLDKPALDWVKLAGGMGVEAVRVETAEAFDDALARALSRDVPVLIEAAT
jgi:acetolactate synthase I/II/III large subunit